MMLAREFLEKKPGEVNASLGKDYVAALARPVPWLSQMFRICTIVCLDVVDEGRVLT